MQSVPVVEMLLILDMEGRGGGGEPEDKTNDPFVPELVMQFFYVSEVCFIAWWLHSHLNISKHR